MDTEWERAAATEALKCLKMYENVFTSYLHKAIFRGRKEKKYNTVACRAILIADLSFPGQGLLITRST
eukprot:4604956-Pyramimonas_sp.AAC.2